MFSPRAIKSFKCIWLLSVVSSIDIRNPVMTLSRHNWMLEFSTSQNTPLARNRPSTLQRINYSNKMPSGWHELHCSRLERRFSESSNMRNRCHSHWTRTEDTSNSLQNGATERAQLSVINDQISQPLSNNEDTSGNLRTKAEEYADTSNSLEASQ